LLAKSRFRFNRNASRILREHAQDDNWKVMIAVIQRVASAKVTVDENVVGEIAHGLLALVAVEVTDGDEQIAWMAHKIVGLRIFRSEGKHFDQDVSQVGGSILLVSNFTVAAETRKGRRPSLDGAAPPAEAEATFAKLVAAVSATGVTVARGKFGGDMRVSLVNDGPATFILRSDRAEKT
jgi:D-tyrosyl-tRNA(Tyr) deacylase